MYEELLKRLRAWEKADVSNWRTFKDAADAIEELICEVADEHNARLDAEERQRWISVTERLPKKPKNYPNWRSCDNCSRHNCHCENLKLWKPIPCPHCRGPLSELRKYRYGGGPIGELARYHRQWYRHCYSCHAEFFAEG